MAKIGKIAANGEVEVDADECALTGLPVAAGDARVPLGNGQFYRVNALAFQKMTPEDHQRIVKEASAPTPAARLKKSEGE